MSWHKMFSLICFEVHTQKLKFKNNGFITYFWKKGSHREGIAVVFLVDVLLDRSGNWVIEGKKINDLQTIAYTSIIFYHKMI